MLIMDALELLDDLVEDQRDECCFRRKLTNIPAKTDHPKLVIFC